MLKRDDKTSLISSNWQMELRLRHNLIVKMSRLHDDVRSVSKYINGYLLISVLSLVNYSSIKMGKLLTQWIFSDFSIYIWSSLVYCIPYQMTSTSVAGIVIVIQSLVSWFVPWRSIICSLFTLFGWVYCGIIMWCYA